jgi:hypothetical protein
MFSWLPLFFEYGGEMVLLLLAHVTDIHTVFQPLFSSKIQLITTQPSIRHAGIYLSKTYNYYHILAYSSSLLIIQIPESWSNWKTLLLRNLHYDCRIIFLLSLTDIVRDFSLFFAVAAKPLKRIWSSSTGSG